VRNIFPIFTNSLALCGTSWTNLACRVALYIQETITQSFVFSFASRILRFLKTNFKHSHSMCLLASKGFSIIKLPSQESVAWCCLWKIILASIATSQQIPLHNSAGRNVTVVPVTVVVLLYIFRSLCRYSYTETYIVLNLNSSHINATFPNNLTPKFHIKIC